MVFLYIRICISQGHPEYTFLCQIMSQEHPEYPGSTKVDLVSRCNCIAHALWTLTNLGKPRVSLSIELSIFRLAHHCFYARSPDLLNSSNWCLIFYISVHEFNTISACEDPISWESKRRARTSDREPSNVFNACQQFVCPRTWWRNLSICESTETSILITSRKFFDLNNVQQEVCGS